MDNFKETCNMVHIDKIILHNFKRFEHLEVDTSADMNILIGDYESGKSTILQAIELTARGSRFRVEEIGLDRLFNVQTISLFMAGKRDMTALPEMYVELYLNSCDNPLLNGHNNSKEIEAFGIKMSCHYDSNYSKQISQIISHPDAIFPLEFYTIDFDTFGGSPYNGYTKYIKSIFIDNSQIGNPHAMREYVHKIYMAKVNENDRITNKHAYHSTKKKFQTDSLDKFNAGIEPYKFCIRDSSEGNIETDINLEENNVTIDNKGTGVQCFVKTKLALNSSVSDIDVVLIEEPETHLSYMNTLKLIELIKGSQNRQLFISTHSDLISTRINLKKCILLNSSGTAATSLSEIDDDTAKFFMKAPDNNMLQFVLSPKVILVEGDAEFILMEAMYKQTIQKELSKSGIGVIAVDGKCFKRYLEIGKLLGIKVAIITDNDNNYEDNIKKNYSGLETPNIKVFSDSDDKRYTFEVCFYNDNKAILDDEFKKLKTNSPLQYMLANKTESAYRILTKHADEIEVPKYIQDAIRWIDA